MNFIMTGHKGLIGSFLLKKLIERGDKPVLLFDIRDTDQKSDDFSSVLPNSNNYKEFGNGKNVLEIDKYPLNDKVDVFIHLASFCKINKIIENPLLTFENNSRCIENVMEFCRNNKIPKIVFTSSSRILSKEKNPYTASKIYGEELLKGYSQCYGIDYAIIRPSTVYGPFNDKTKRLMDIWILNALKGEELKIFGDENKTLDFTYIDDFVEGFLLAMEEKNKEFDISYGKSVKLNHVADLIIRLAGESKFNDSIIEKKGFKGFYEPEIAQPQEVELDISKIRNLGFSPKIDIEEGVKRTFEWYKDNLDEIENSR